MRHLLALLMAFTTLSAQADIVYQWQGNNDATPYGITMQLVFADTAFDDGVVDLQMITDAGRPQVAPASELLGLHYTMPVATTVDRIDFDPRVGIRSYARLQLHFELSSSGLLSGNLYANNAMHDIHMAGEDDLFRVVDAHSDRTMYWAGCGWSGPCGGATGTFQRVHDQPLPEPLTLGLTILGLLGMRYSRRR